jgi:hypothetical protein
MLLRNFTVLRIFVLQVTFTSNEFQTLSSSSVVYYLFSTQIVSVTFPVYSRSAFLYVLVLCGLSVSDLHCSCFEFCLCVCVPS